MSDAKNVVPKRTWYKCLAGDKACHGGIYTYSLPVFDTQAKRWTPGNWAADVKHPKICRIGYHLTQKPRQWLQGGPEFRVFVAEGRGPSSNNTRDGHNKTAFTSARLLRPATPEEFYKLTGKAETLGMVELWKQTGKAYKSYKELARKAEKEAVRKRKERQLAERIRQKQQRIGYDVRIMARYAKRYGFVIKDFKRTLAKVLKAVK